MNFLEECLTLGDWLSQENRRALYKYFLESNRDTYNSQANLLVSDGSLTKTIANGQIYYLVKDRLVNYSSRRLDSDEFTPVIREMKLTGFKFYDIKRLNQFFAQSDVDVIHNFPLPGLNPQSDNGFGINAYPYYDLNYYSNGKGKLLGLVNRIKTNDRELLNKLKGK